MKRIVMTLLIVATLITATASIAMAGGGKVRGENGQGSVVQVQVQDPPPFQ